MRRWLTFASGNDSLAATIDGIDGETGLLIVSGGNEIRSGSHGGMAAHAWRIAEAGYPVLRYDRAGVGDSTGTNSGFLESAGDIAAAAACFRREIPSLRRIVAFGNCDAATALALFNGEHASDALVLANPWLIEDSGGDDTLPPAAAIRSRYREKLRNPRELLRLATGKVNIFRLIKGLISISKVKSQNALADKFANAVNEAPCPIEIILAEHDATARVFADHWAGPAFATARQKIPVHRLNSTSHSFATAQDADALFTLLLASLARASRHF